MRFLLLKFVAAPTIDSLPDAGTLDAIDQSTASVIAGSPPDAVATTSDR